MTNPLSATATRELHTPLPWRIDPHKGTIVGQSGEFVADLGLSEPNLFEEDAARATADANLIVQAANSHDSLLKACEAVLGWLSPEDPLGNMAGLYDPNVEDDGSTTHKDEAIRVLRNALASAKLKL